MFSFCKNFLWKKFIHFISFSHYSMHNILFQGLLTAKSIVVNRLSPSPDSQVYVADAPPPPPLMALLRWICRDAESGSTALSRVPRGYFDILSTERMFVWFWCCRRLDTQSEENCYNDVFSRTRAIRAEFHLYSSQEQVLYFNELTKKLTSASKLSKQK